MKNIKFLSSEDAVSEVVDFVTILGLLVLSTGLIGVAGYPIIQDAKEASHIENTEQSFIVMANNINKIVTGQAPSQNIEIKMYGGSLSVTGNSSINITARNSMDESISFSRQMRSIKSVIGDTIIAYEGTGVWIKHPNGNTTLISRPLISNQSNVLIFPFVTLGGITSIAGSGMSRVAARGIPDIVVWQNVSNINVTIDSDYSDGWENYFSNVEAWNLCDTVECTVKLDMKNIDVYILNVQLDTEII